MKRNVLKFDFWILAAFWLVMTGMDAKSADLASAMTNSSSVATNEVSIDDLVAEITKSNSELGFYRAEIAAAKGERRTAGTLANPELSGTLGGKRVDGASLAGEGLVWSLSVRQALVWPGGIGLRKAIGNRQIRLAEVGLEQFKNALAARSRVLAYNLFAAQEKAACGREVVERLGALREVIVQRDPAGVTPLLERRIIEATELTLQRKASEEILAEQAALLELNQLRGQPWAQPLRVRRPTLTFPSGLSTEILSAAALTNNFELQMRAVELEQQGFKVSLAKNEKYPSVSVGPYVSQERAGDRETQFGIGLSVPLPLWNRNSGKVAFEEARREQAATSLVVMQRQIERQIAERSLLYQTKVAEMTKWRTNAIEEFKEAASGPDRHYRLAAVPISTSIAFPD